MPPYFPRRQSTEGFLKPFLLSVVKNISGERERERNRGEDIGGGGGISREGRRVFFYQNPPSIRWCADRPVTSLGVEVPG